MIINDKNKNKKLTNNILSLSQLAKKAKTENNEIINSTAGMLFDENNKLFTFSSVKKVMENLSDEKMFAYNDTIGSVNFQQAIIEWVLGEYKNEYKEFNIKAISTPGGSGAISLTFSTYTNKGDKVLLPNIMWETYITYANERECSYLTYDVYDNEGKLNIDNIKNCLDQLKNQENIVLVINDPCQNPMGFCLTDDDYDKLIELLNSCQHNIVLLMDIAYFDYYSSNGSIIRKRFSKLTKLKDHILTIFAFSGSKTFGLYGLRIGAAIAMSRDSKEIEYFKNCFEYISRANWSSSSSLGASIIEELILNKNYSELYKNELKEISNILETRANIFLEECKKVNLKILPFEHGFFVCVPTKNPQVLAEKLHQDNVYVVPTKTCIRIAICSININECKKLPSIIKNRLEKEAL